MKKTICLLSFLCLAFSGVVWGQKIEFDPELATQYAHWQGKIAPNFTLEDATGKRVSLSDLKGSVVYLHFWADWCGVCLGEMPDLKDLSERLKGQDVVIVNVAIDSDKANWQELLAKHQIPGINLFDPKPERDKSRTEKVYNFEVLPTYVIIGKDGKILGHDVPPPDEDILPDWALYQATKGIGTKQAYERYVKNDASYSLWIKDFIKKL